MRGLGVLLFCALTACSKAPASGSEKQAVAIQTSAEPANPIIDTSSGPYQLNLDPSIDPKLMPVNADLKMVDGNITEYAVKLCGLDTNNNQQPERCEVFVQPDKPGLLVGYVVLRQGRDVQIDTVVETDTQRGGLGCFLSGELKNYDFERPASKLDISKNFMARMEYSAWEKSPGNWLVSTAEDFTDSQASKGMWYVQRVGNKLRISQERWSYCYSDPKIYLDEVFRRAVTLTRANSAMKQPH